MSRIDFTVLRLFELIPADFLEPLLLTGDVVFRLGSRVDLEFTFYCKRLEFLSDRGLLRESR